MVYSSAICIILLQVLACECALGLGKGKDSSVLKCTYFLKKKMLRLIFLKIKNKQFQFEIN